MKSEPKDNFNKIEDAVKKDVVVNSALARTRRLLKSKAKMEMADPAASLKVRISKLSAKYKEPENMEGIDEKDVKSEIVLNDVDEFCRCSFDLASATCLRITGLETSFSAQNLDRKTEQSFYGRISDTRKQNWIFWRETGAETGF